MARLHAHWVYYMDAWRVYDPDHPNTTVAYLEDGDERLKDIIKDGNKEA